MLPGVETAEAEVTYGPVLDGYVSRQRFEFGAGRESSGQSVAYFVSRNQSPVFHYLNGDSLLCLTQAGSGRDGHVTAWRFHYRCCQITGVH